MIKKFLQIDDKGAYCPPVVNVFSICAEVGFAGSGTLKGLDSGDEDGDFYYEY